MVDNAELSSILFGILDGAVDGHGLGQSPRHRSGNAAARSEGSGDADLVGEAHVAMANTLFWLGTVLQALACHGTAA